MIIKSKFLKLLVFLIFSLYFLFTCSQLVYGAALELEYPETILGTTITGSSDIAQYLKYVFEAGIALGLIVVVITFAVAGILYFLSPIPNSTSKAKEMLSGATSGLLIIVLAYLIITTINPYLSVFNMDPLADLGETPDEEIKTYGLSVYKSEGCSNLGGTYKYNILDFEGLKNIISSVKIAQDTESGASYIAILYDNINNWGACQYIDPNKGCQKSRVSVASATVYEYNFSPSGNGIVLYRNSFNKVSGKGANKDNGYLRISQGDIGGLYWQELKNLSFTGDSIRQPDITTSPNDSSSCTVPYPERDCVKWSDSGLCIARRCPTLDQENLSSIELDGDYLVVLLYIGPNDDTNNFTYSYCQAFPAESDINKYGPQQVKWDAIRSSGRKPNYILIIPIKN